LRFGWPKRPPEDVGTQLLARDAAEVLDLKDSLYRDAAPLGYGLRRDAEIASEFGRTTRCLNRSADYVTRHARYVKLALTAMSSQP